MALGSTPVGINDARADYDFRGGETESPDFAADLKRRIDGDLRFDDYSRQLYATDASAYEVTPIGVAYPRSTEDVAAIASYCAERKIPILPRGGGTSLAGQAVNEAFVLDFTRHMGDVLDVDPDGATASVQAGAVLEELNDALEPHGLKFAPDPAAGDRSTIGGAIGNNSTGAHSLQYGKTDAYVESVEAVLADGSVATFGEMTVDELRDRADPDGGIEGRIYAELARILDEDAEEIADAFPQLKRNVSGYNLDRFVEEADSGTVNVARVLAGSEGTLAVVTEATVSLEPVPETTSLALLTYSGIDAAMRDVALILEHDPAALEVLDDVLLDLARDTEEFADLAAMLPEETQSALLVEFYADSDEEGRRKVANLIADRLPGTVESNAGPAPGGAITDADPYAFDVLEAHSDDAQTRFWKLRKSAAPILLSRTSDAKHISFIEDSAVPPENLPEYVADVRSILEEYDTFASFYAHAGPGCLHIRPLVSTKTTAGLEEMESLADDVTDLVVEYDGSVSGEHGDGRARTQWNHKLYGDDVWCTFRELKSAFDPDWIFNPGQVCGRPPRDVDGDGVEATLPDLNDDLRFDPGYEFDPGFDPSLEWDNENGFQGMAELCHGCAGCRGQQDTTGGVMCPTYRAAEEEIASTRGRANMLRRAMSGSLPEDEQFSDEFVTEVLDLCIGCKGCARDCPSEVDMAKMKAELTHEYHQRQGASLRDHLFANIDTVARLGSATAPISNWLPKLPGARFAMEKAFGIARERKLPTFSRRTLADWMADRESPVPPKDADRHVLMFPDTYTNYSDPEIGKAAVSVLEAANVHVRLPSDVADSGRPAFSKGFLDLARSRARENVRALAPKVQDGWDVVAVEPSDAVMIQSDYLDLLSGDDVERVAGSTFEILEYLDCYGLDVPTADSETTLTYHGHCHQTAIKRELHAPNVLERAGYDVDVLDSGCCGMAGSFGYEAEHVSMSEAIGSILFDQVDESAGEQVVAPGTSCRSQLSDLAGSDAVHPVEVLARAASPDE